MRKTILILAAVALAIIAAIGIMTIVHNSSDDLNEGVFPKNVTINGVDCSGLNYTDASKALTDAWNSNTMIVVGSLDDQLTSYSDFGCTYNLADQMANIGKDHPVAAALNHYLHTPLHANVAMMIVDYDEDFKDTVTDSKFLKTDAVETRNAYVDMESGDFNIVKEVYGTTPDPDKYFNAVLESIELGNFMFKYNESDYITAPTVKSTDEDLIKYQKFCKKYLKQKITYELGDETFTISVDDLQGMLSDDMDGSVDEEAVAHYVAGLCKKYDTAGVERTFTSLTGKKITVSGGTYGWTINKDAETAQLIADIQSHKNVSREPEFYQRGWGEYSSSLGKTYVDVDIAKQHLSYFKNGKLAFETDVVTGCPAAGHSTVLGTFYINSKQRNVTLKGRENNGEKYESFVSYWMAFYGASYGLHDASWRSTFGGDIYKYNGSHGCVNMPPAKTGTLYNILEIGTPVVVHY